MGSHASAPEPSTVAAATAAAAEVEVDLNRTGPLPKKKTLKRLRSFLGRPLRKKTEKEQKQKEAAEAENKNAEAAEAVQVQDDADQRADTEIGDETAAAADGPDCSRPARLSIKKLKHLVPRDGETPTNLSVQVK